MGFIRNCCRLAGIGVLDLPAVKSHGAPRLGKVCAKSTWRGRSTVIRFQYGSHLMLHGSCWPAGRRWERCAHSPLETQAKHVSESRFAAHLMT